jgi:signal peptidase I
MTRPGPPPPRGRHAASDGGARPDPDVPSGGRHAAADEPPAPPARRRHAAPEFDDYAVDLAGRTGNGRIGAHAVPDADTNGHTAVSDYTPDHPGAIGSAGGRYDDRYGSPALGADGAAAGTYGRPNGHGGAHGPAADGSAEAYGGPDGAPGYGGPNGYGGVGGAGGYGGPNGAGGYGGPDGAGGYGGPDGAAGPGYGGGVNGAGINGAGINGSAGPRRRHAAEEDDRYGPPDIDGHPSGSYPWREVNGYHLDQPAPPAVNGYHLDEPVAPVNGFPYTGAPETDPWPVNGHGVDAAERAASSWAGNGRAAPLTGWQRQPFRPSYPPLPPEPAPAPAPVVAPTPTLGRTPVPTVGPAPAPTPTVGPSRVPTVGPAPVPDAAIAVVPLETEAAEVAKRPARAGTKAPPDKPSHPPRAVVRRRRARRKALEWPFLITFALISAFLIRAYVVQTFFIPSASMHETLIEGDRVLVNKVSYHLHEVHRGDVVVFRKPPALNVSEDDLIKRIVGLPGETVEGRGGKVYVDGAPLSEPYVEPLCHGTSDFKKETVPAGKLWVMGDNRCNSSDSRYFGPIDKNLVVGRAFVIAWPVGRLSWL